MANVKITALTNLSGADVEDRDVFVIDDLSETETKKITIQNVTVFTGNAHLVQANVTAEDAALQARITANAATAAAAGQTIEFKNWAKDFLFEDDIYLTGAQKSQYPVPVGKSQSKANATENARAN